MAPMLNYSDRHFRALLRILSKRAVLWTEMVVDETICHAPNLDVHLGEEEDANPIVCQIGGNSPTLAGECASIIAERYAYDEINLNCECPSKKVAHQREFGAALMKKPHLVASILKAMKKKRNLKLSVKTRIGVVDSSTHDENDSYDMHSFIETLQPICKRFIMHAREVHLQGLNARQNRTVPPLDYPFVFELCRCFPHCEFFLNGGISSLQEARRLCYGDDSTEMDSEHHHKVPCSLCAAPYGSCIAPQSSVPPNLRGCMLGRAATENPSLFWDVDRYFYGMPSNPCQNRRDVLLQYCRYLERTYPRRCIDSDERITYRFPPPDVVPHLYCTICGPTYGMSNDTEVHQDHRNVADAQEDDSSSEVDAVDCNGRRENKRLTGLGNGNENRCDDDEDGLAKFKRRCPGQKVSSKVIGRALKPVHCLFFGMPCLKAFRRSCNDLVKDTTIRNCGPGFILRKAMESVPDQFLDEAFVKTEDLVGQCMKNTRHLALNQD